MFCGRDAAENEANAGAVDCVPVPVNSGRIAVNFPVNYARITDTIEAGAMAARAGSLDGVSSIEKDCFL